MNKTKCGVTDCNNMATHTWSGHPTCDACGIRKTPSDQSGEKQNRMNDQEKRELLIKAAVKFEGKWPEGATLLYRLGEKVTAAKANGDLSPIEVPSPANVSNFLIVREGSWQPFCNQQEFEAFMDELADKAPEGAEHYSPKEGKFAECWFKFDGEWMFSIIGGEKWHRLTPKSIIEKRSLIPLPKREPAPWTPEVGRECEATWGAKCAWHKFVIASEFGFALVGDCWQRRLVCYFDSIEFRPIRTEAEIERQALYDSLCELDADLDDYQINRVIEFIQGRDDE